MPRMLTFYFITYIFFLFNRQPHMNKRHTFIFIGIPKNPINDKISIFLLNNIYILFKDNFRNIVNQAPTWLF
jgi:cbb3-type cytochrome oxidase subunit 3